MNLQYAIQMNNHAVSLLERQRFQEATESFISALHQLRLLSLEGPGESPPPNHSDSSNIDYCMRMSDLAPLYGDDTTGHQFTYTAGITVPLNITLHEVCLSSIVIFNTALSFQLSRSASQRALHQAKDLYALALNQASCVLNPAFRVAIMNNLGVLCRSDAQDEEAEQIFASLESFGMCLLISGRGHALQKVSSFWVNIRPTHRAAPVA